MNFHFRPEVLDLAASEDYPHLSGCRQLCSKYKMRIHRELTT